MGFKLSEIEEGKHVTLCISNEHNRMRIRAIIKKRIKDNFALIGLEYPEERRLIFDKVKIDVEYGQDNDIPIVWRNAKIANYKNEYVLQVASDGVKSNRRNSFRVSVAKTGRLFISGVGSSLVMVRDVSLSGFSIADRQRELKLAMGNAVTLSFEDMGYEISLSGRLRRIEEREDMIVYGFEINSLCKDLSAYVSGKQRHNRRRK